MRAERKDSNHADVVSELRAYGATVEVLPGGNGRPDLLVGYKHRNFLMEVKDATGVLNPLQRKFHEAWGGMIHVVRSGAAATAVLKYWTK